MVAVRPPEYFPNLDYLALMATVSTFVLADTFQYSRQSLQNRTRLCSRDGVHWLTVPLKGGQHGRSQDATALGSDPTWRKRHWKAFLYNYTGTPYFVHYQAAVAKYFAHRPKMLADATCASVRLVHQLFGLSSRLIRASDLPGRPDTLLAAVRQLPQKTLLLPRLSAHFDRPQVPGSRVMDFEPPAYRHNCEGFAARVTSLDMLFHCGPESMARIRAGVRVT